MSEPVAVRGWRLPDDAEQIARVTCESLEYHRHIDPDPVQPPPSLEQVLRAVMVTTLDDGRLRLAAEMDKGVAGFVVAELRREEQYGWCGAWVSDLAVAERWRNHGIGTLLLTAAEGWARERGALSIALDTLVTNQAALRLYERRGYRTKGLVLGRRL